MGLHKLIEPLPAMERAAAGQSSPPTRRAHMEAVKPIVQCTERAIPLTVLEQTVVALSLHDDIRSFANPGGLRQVIFQLFGSTLPNRLSDPRLEALRRFAVVSRERIGDLHAERVLFQAAGYTAGNGVEVERLLERAMA